MQLKKVMDAFSRAAFCKPCQKKQLLLASKTSSILYFKITFAKDLLTRHHPPLTFLPRANVWYAVNQTTGSHKKGVDAIFQSLKTSCFASIKLYNYVYNNILRGTTVFYSRKGMSGLPCPPCNCHLCMAGFKEKPAVTDNLSLLYQSVLSITLMLRSSHR